MVGPLGQHQQLTGVTGKAFLGKGRELGQVVVGDQRPTWLANAAVPNSAFGSS